MIACQFSLTRCEPQCDDIARAARCVTFSLQRDIDNKLSHLPIQRGAEENVEDTCHHCNRDIETFRQSIHCWANLRGRWSHPQQADAKEKEQHHQLEEPRDGCGGIRNTCDQCQEDRLHNVRVKDPQRWGVAAPKEANLAWRFLAPKAACTQHAPRPDLWGEELFKDNRDRASDLR